MSNKFLEGHSLIFYLPLPPRHYILIYRFTSLCRGCKWGLYMQGSCWCSMVVGLNTKRSRWLAKVMQCNLHETKTSPALNDTKCSALMVRSGAPCKVEVLSKVKVILNFHLNSLFTVRYFSCYWYCAELKCESLWVHLPSGITSCCSSSRVQLGKHMTRSYFRSWYFVFTSC